MKTKHIILLFLGLGWSYLTNAQTSETANPAELITTPPAISENLQIEEPELVVKEKTTTASTPKKFRYSLAMGSQFSRFGSAAYLQPTMMYPVSNRLQAFASVTMVNSFSPVFGRQSVEGGFPSSTNFSRQSFIVHAGGNYAVNDRLNLTGSIWRDFSKNNHLPNSPINLFSPAGTNGMLFRANYKVTENFSISGGFRYSNGNRYYNPIYQNYDPFGF